VTTRSGRRDELSADLRGSTITLFARVKRTVQPDMACQSRNCSRRDASMLPVPTGFVDGRLLKLDKPGLLILRKLNGAPRGIRVISQDQAVSPSCCLNFGKRLSLESLKTSMPRL